MTFDVLHLIVSLSCLSSLFSHNQLIFQLDLYLTDVCSILISTAGDDLMSFRTLSLLPDGDTSVHFMSPTAATYHSDYSTGSGPIAVTLDRHNSAKVWNDLCQILGTHLQLGFSAKPQNMLIQIHGIHQLAQLSKNQLSIQLFFLLWLFFFPDASSPTF